jgi:hypothetical protein
VNPRLLPIALAGCCLLALARGPGAVAATRLSPIPRVGRVLSGNWSGYAVHGQNARFDLAIGSWREPARACTDDRLGYSAFWVGLGGYSLTSDALEQIGTELDCNANGTDTLFGWYELLPAPSHQITAMVVRPGDRMTASVAVELDRVTLTLADDSRRERFLRTFSDRSIDLSSAEWIAEAPSQCASATRCRVLPLADYGSVSFTGAAVRTSSGARGSILDPRWDATEITLGAGRSERAQEAITPSSMPSPLRDDGRAFSIAFGAPAGRGAPPSPGPGGERLIQGVGRHAG